MLDIFNIINGILWRHILVYLLIGTGIYFTLRLGFIQIRHFLHTFSVMRNSRKSDKEGISSFQLDKMTLGIVLVIFTGIRGIAKVAERIVPSMAH